MWKKQSISKDAKETGLAVWGKEFLVNAWVEVFYIGKKKVIILWPRQHIRSGTCTAHIHGFKPSQHITIHDPDYEVLKIKAIMKAKEIGYDVKF